MTASIERAAFSEGLKQKIFETLFLEQEAWKQLGIKRRRFKGRRSDFNFKDHAEKHDVPHPVIGNCFTGKAQTLPFSYYKSIDLNADPTLITHMNRVFLVAMCKSLLEIEKIPMNRLANDVADNTDYSYQSVYRLLNPKYLSAPISKEVVKYFLKRYKQHGLKTPKQIATRINFLDDLLVENYETILGIPSHKPVITLDGVSLQIGSTDKSRVEKTVNAIQRIGQTLGVSVISQKNGAYEVLQTHESIYSDAELTHELIRRYILTDPVLVVRSGGGCYEKLFVQTADPKKTAYTFKMRDKDYIALFCEDPKKIEEYEKKLGIDTCLTTRTNNLGVGVFRTTQPEEDSPAQTTAQILTQLTTYDPTITQQTHPDIHTYLLDHAIKEIAKTHTTGHTRHP